MSVREKTAPPGTRPCPFCQGERLTIIRWGDLDGLTLIRCESCIAVVSFHGNEQQAATLAAWNRRGEAVG